MTVKNKWKFWIDRGGTFTDIVAQSPDGRFHSKKLLSENPECYEDAALKAIADFMGGNIKTKIIEHVKMGTTIGTNALLEHEGEKTLLITTKGFKDQVKIGYQARPKIFARKIELPQMLYSDVLEVEERYSANGAELIEINEKKLKKDLKNYYQKGYRCCAIIFMHGYKFTKHEKIAAQIAKDIGFSQISVSHKTAPLIKFVARADTTIVDAYLSPILKRYISQISSKLDETKLMFMRSSGGLTDAKLFAGKDCILSGPAGGIVGAAESAKQAGFNKIIGFDMGGTSTDVAHFAGSYEKSLETIIAGARIRAPMMDIHTVAAGGGSICFFDGMRYRVGPKSAGANPGPAAYRRGGPLTVTDCNVMLGKLRAEFFPKIFGKSANLPLDIDIVKTKFNKLKKEINDGRTEEEIAAGFLDIAVLTMADAIKKISIQRGYDISEYTLSCFGGAGGQHACLVADNLGIKTILIHPFAGVLSAYGMGLAPITATSEQSFEEKLSKKSLIKAKNIIKKLEEKNLNELERQKINKGQITTKKQLYIKYAGTDRAENVKFGNIEDIIQEFENKYKKRYGFLMLGADLIIETIAVETINFEKTITNINLLEPTDTEQKITIVDVYMAGKYRKTPIYKREYLLVDKEISGPAIILDSTGTTIIEPNWQAKIDSIGNIVITKSKQNKKNTNIKEDLNKADPVTLEIFNNLFMSVAEQMGSILENTAYSVNIKERLDFSCAVFDENGGLVANAPHMPVHLGSMGDSVKEIINNRKNKMQIGDVYMLNDPYHGGTHLPDITVITPVFIKNNKIPDFYVATRGHHADIGGITPGSMPAFSTNIAEEGVMLKNIQIVKNGIFQEKYIKKLLKNNKYPARNIEQNIKDLKAQIAANTKGVDELNKMTQHFGLKKVKAYMQHIQKNAEEHVRRAIADLKIQDASFVSEMDNGAKIKVTIKIDKINRCVEINFTDTNAQLNNSNFNAPLSVCRAAVLYVFRSLVDDDIPMNEGCLKPIKLIVPKGSMLNPTPPAAVVAGNVETSQVITDTLYGALKIMASAQGTMNNFTFGNDKYQYYETICGGSGAGDGFSGTDAVQTHMTNSRLTDPEILETRFPVILEEFSIRKNSGGMGKYTGGNGTIRRIKFLENMTVSMLANHYKILPFGLNGGKDGKAGAFTIIRANGKIEKMPSTAQTQVKNGDLIEIKTAGGGGFGKTSKKQ